MGNSWRGMLLREQGVRVESRFSGSGLTPCSAIPSRPRCHDRPVVSGLAAALGNSRLISFSRILRFWLYTAPVLASTPALFLLLSTVGLFSSQSAPFLCLSITFHVHWLGKLSILNNTFTFRHSVADFLPETLRHTHICWRAS